MPALKMIFAPLGDNRGKVGKAGAEWTIIQLITSSPIVMPRGGWAGRVGANRGCLRVRRSSLWMVPCRLSFFRPGTGSSAGTLVL